MEKFPGGAGFIDPYPPPPPPQPASTLTHNPDETLRHIESRRLISISLGCVIANECCEPPRMFHEMTNESPFFLLRPQCGSLKTSVLISRDLSADVLEGSRFGRGPKRKSLGMCQIESELVQSMF